MSTNEERREAARRKLEERLERERQTAKKRRLTMLAAAGVTVVAIAAVGGFFWYKKWDDDRHTECTYTEADTAADFRKSIQSIEQQLGQVPAEQKAAGEALLASLKENQPKLRTSPMPESRALNTGDASVSLTTPKGDIDISLDRSVAACNVNAVMSLASNGYYDGTSCYQISQTPNVTGLQCGDPTRTGLGGPGWTSPDEVPTHLKEAPMDPQTAAMGGQQTVIYPRGTVAIMNSNGGTPPQVRENTGGANFVIFTKDSQLPADLAVVGTVDDAGMAIVDQVMKGGIAPGPLTTEQNGAPKTPLEIKSASAA